MFEHARSCNHALFRHMTHDENRDSHALRNLHQHICRLSHLTHASRSRISTLTEHRLDRVNDHDLRLILTNTLPDRLEIRLTQEIKLSTDLPDSRCPHLDLLERLLSRDIEYPMPIPCKISADLQ